MTEKELIEKSLKGDERAFEELIKLYQPKILHYCMGKVNHSESAADLTQEILIKAYNNLPKFRGDSSLYTWLYRIAHNVVVNHYKKQAGHREVEFKEEHLKEAEAPADANYEHLLRSIEQLPPKQKIVMELFELQKMSIKEIAAHLGIPSGTVRSRLHYGRKRLKELIKLPPEV